MLISLIKQISEERFTTLLAAACTASLVVTLSYIKHFATRISEL